MNQDISEKIVKDRIYRLIQGIIDEIWPGSFMDDGLSGNGITVVEQAVLSKLLAKRSAYADCSNCEKWVEEWEESFRDYVGLLKANKNS